MRIFLNIQVKILLAFFFFIFANKSKSKYMEYNLENIKSIKLRFKKSKMVLELLDSETLQDGDFLLLNGGKIIHSSNKKFATVDEIELISGNGDFIGRYFRSDVGINEPDTAIVWHKLD